MSSKTYLIMGDSTYGDMYAVLYDAKGKLALNMKEWIDSKQTLYYKLLKEPSECKFIIAKKPEFTFPRPKFSVFREMDMDLIATACPKEVSFLDPAFSKFPEQKIRNPKLISGLNNMFTLPSRVDSESTSRVMFTSVLPLHGIPHQCEDLLRANSTPLYLNTNLYITIQFLDNSTSISEADLKPANSALTLTQTLTQPLTHSLTSPMNTQTFPGPVTASASPSNSNANGSPVSGGTTTSSNMRVKSSNPPASTAVNTSSLQNTTQPPNQSPTQPNKNSFQSLVLLDSPFSMLFNQVNVCVEEEWERIIPMFNCCLAGERGKRLLKHINLDIPYSFISLLVHGPFIQMIYHIIATKSSEQVNPITNSLTGTSSVYSLVTMMQPTQPLTPIACDLASLLLMSIGTPDYSIVLASPAVAITQPVIRFMSPHRKTLYLESLAANYVNLSNVKREKKYEGKEIRNLLIQSICQRRQMDVMNELNLFEELGGEVIIEPDQFASEKSMVPFENVIFGAHDITIPICHEGSNRSQVLYECLDSLFRSQNAIFPVEMGRHNKLKPPFSRPTTDLPSSSYMESDDDDDDDDDSTYHTPSNSNDPIELLSASERVLSSHGSVSGYDPNMVFNKLDDSNEHEYIHGEIPRSELANPRDSLSCGFTQCFGREKVIRIGGYLAHDLSLNRSQPIGYSPAHSPRSLEIEALEKAGKRVDADEIRKNSVICANRNFLFEYFNSFIWKLPVKQWPIAQISNGGRLVILCFYKSFEITLKRLIANNKNTPGMFSNVLLVWLPFPDLVGHAGFSTEYEHFCRILGINLYSHSAAEESTVRSAIYENAYAYSFLSFLNSFLPSTFADMQFLSFELFEKYVKRYSTPTNAREEAKKNEIVKKSESIEELNDLFMSESDGDDQVSECVNETADVNESLSILQEKVFGKKKGVKRENILDLLKASNPPSHSLTLPMLQQRQPPNIIAENRESVNDSLTHSLAHSPASNEGVSEGVEDEFMKKLKQIIEKRVRGKDEAKKTEGSSEETSEGGGEWRGIREIYSNCDLIINMTTDNVYFGVYVPGSESHRHSRFLYFQNVMRRLQIANFRCSIPFVTCLPSVRVSEIRGDAIAMNAEMRHWGLADVYVYGPVRIEEISLLKDVSDLLCESEKRKVASSLLQQSSLLNSCGIVYCNAFVDNVILMNKQPSLFDLSRAIVDPFPPPPKYYHFMEISLLSHSLSYLSKLTANQSHSLIHPSSLQKMFLNYDALTDRQLQEELYPSIKIDSVCVGVLLLMLTIEYSDKKMISELKKTIWNELVKNLVTLDPCPCKFVFDQASMKKLF